MIAPNGNSSKTTTTTFVRAPLSSTAAAAGSAPKIRPFAGLTSKKTTRNSNGAGVR
jgi:hypothetical protein